MTPACSQQGQHEVVPDRYELEQKDGDHRRGDERNDDNEERPQTTRPIKSGGLAQFVEASIETVAR